MLFFIRAQCLTAFHLHAEKKLAEFCPIAALLVLQTPKILARRADFSRRELFNPEPPATALDPSF
jgi:hypothetical protein